MTNVTKRSSIRNFVAVVAWVSPRTLTVMAEGSMSVSPARIGLAIGGISKRRSRALTRATNSPELKGFETQSPAPRFRPRIRSASPFLAVRKITAVAANDGS